MTSITIQQTPVIIAQLSPTTATDAPALGTNAKERTPQVLLDQVFTDGSDNLPRRLRYSRQATVRRLMKSEYRVNRQGESKNYRVSHCLWSLTNKADAGLHVKLTTLGATFGGLQICGSVWHCPVCAARIANQRSKEIQECIDAAKLRGYKAVLLTYTARHSTQTSLDDQLEAMSKSYESVWRGASAKRLKAKFKVFGMIRTLECTAGTKGWHPHIHAIAFIPEDMDTKQFGEAIRHRWEEMASKHGLTMNHHGFDATDAQGRIADYVVKFGHQPKISTWTESQELARWNSKKGRRMMGVKFLGELDDHLTPWELLDASQQGNTAAGGLFVEYAKAYHGRQQVSFGNLRKLLGLDKELTDEEAAEKESEEAKKICTVQFTYSAWCSIRGQDMRAELLELIELAAGDEQLTIQSCFDAFGFYPVVDYSTKSDDDDV